jgi:transposase
MIRSYKYRIKDRSARKALLAYAYASNQVWNWCVAQQRDMEDRYRAGAPRRKWLSAFALSGSCKGVGAMLGIHQQTVQNICEQFARSRDQHKRCPRFRASFGMKRSLGWIPFQQQSRQICGNSVTYLGKQFRLFGNKRRALPEIAKGGCFVEDALGRWYVIFHVDIEETVRAQTGAVGIDLGLKTLATLSDGAKVENLRHRQNWAKQLATAQRSRNKRRTRAIHAKIANARKDHLHKITTELAARYALIAVGNVNSAKLAKTRMAKSVLDAGWSTFRSFLRYKSPGYVEIDERFTSQTCSTCGSLPPSRPKGIAGLGMRAWACSDCGASHDRDVNAARNILRLGLSAQPLAEESRRVA